MAKTLRLNKAAIGVLLSPPSPPVPRLGWAGRQPARKAPATRLDQIRQTGCHLLFLHGYSGMTMREIAAKLKIKAASLYYHFPSKQQILLDLMHATVTELLRGLREIVDSGRDPETELDAAIRWHVLFHAQKREEAFVSHSELRSLEAENLKTILKLRREYESLFDGILRRGRRKGVFQVEQLSVIRNGILTMGTAVAGWFSPQGPLSAEEIADQISRFVRAGVVKG